MIKRFFLHSASLVRCQLLSGHRVGIFPIVGDPETAQIAHFLPDIVRYGRFVLPSEPFVFAYAVAHGRQHGSHLVAVAHGRIDFVFGLFTSTGFGAQTDEAFADTVFQSRSVNTFFQSAFTQAEHSVSQCYAGDTGRGGKSRLTLAALLFGKIFFAVGMIFGGFGADDKARST